MDVYDKLRDPLALAIFAFTLALPVIVGLLVMRRTRSQSDFFVGGKAMDRIVVALSAVATGRSSWLVLGVSGMAYTMGVSAVWSVVGYILVEMLQFVWIGRPLRRLARSDEAITLLDVLAARFEDRRHLVRLTGAAIIGIFITAYVAAQLNAGAKSLTSALHLPLPASIAVSALLILAYMVVGGYIAVAWNDVVRALIMIVALVVLPALGLAKIGGLGALLDTLAALRPSLVDPTALGAGALIGFLGIGLGSPGQPHVLVRYMSVDDPEKLRLSAVVGTVWNVVLGWGALMIGLLGRAAVPDAASLPDRDPELVFLVLSTRTFGPALYGLMVGGIFAAILSTADSQLLVVASTLVRDVYEKVIRKGAPLGEARRVRLGRIAVVAAGIAAVALAWAAEDLVFWLVLFAWGGLGASIGTAVIFCLFWKRTTSVGVVAGMITGTVVTVLWKLLLKAPTGIYELIPAFLCASLVIVILGVAGIGSRIRGSHPST
jgi:SSS family solute:Na+ symporter